MVKNFREKPQTKNDWINGGFLINPEFIDLLNRSNNHGKIPLEKISSMNG